MEGRCVRVCGGAGGYISVTLVGTSVYRLLLKVGAYRNCSIVLCCIMGVNCLHGIFYTKKTYTEQQSPRENDS